jgi:hypothetical protein
MYISPHFQVLLECKCQAFFGCVDGVPRPQWQGRYWSVATEISGMISKATKATYYCLAIPLISLLCSSVSLLFCLGTDLIASKKDIMYSYNISFGEQQ